MNFLLQGNALLALGAAVLWGGGDFSGGMGVKHAGENLQGALRVVLLSHAVSFSVLLVVAWARGDAFPHGALLAWGIGAGVSAGASLTLFYLALSRGAMGASAAVSGLLAAAIPAMVSMATEGSPGVLRVAGFVVAGVAIWMIAAGPAEVTETAGKAEAKGTMGMAIAAGAGFGIYFVGLKHAGAGGVVWPMATSRIGSLSVCALILASTRIGAGRIGAGRGGGKEAGGIRWAVARWAVLTAALDTTGNMMFIAATRAGRLDVAAVLASLYPASTIVLAAWVLREKFTGRQGWGMAVAAVAVVMIAA